jgi:hypothetical protein
MSRHLDPQFIRNSKRKLIREICENLISPGCRDPPGSKSQNSSHFRSGKRRCTGTPSCRTSLTTLSLARSLSGHHSVSGFSLALSRAERSGMPVGIRSSPSRTAALCLSYWSPVKLLLGRYRKKSRRRNARKAMTTRSNVSIMTFIMLWPLPSSISSKARIQERAPGRSLFVLNQAYRVDSNLTTCPARRSARIRRLSDAAAAPLPLQPHVVMEPSVVA